MPSFDDCSDKEKPFCTTAIFEDNYAMFTCGSDDTQTMVTAFYHSTGPAGASSGAAKSVNTQKQQSSGSAAGSSNQSGSHDDSSSFPLATVLGAVIGGIAVILIAVFLAWFVLRTKRKDNLAAARLDSGLASGKAVEMIKPPGTSQSQTSELQTNEKKQPMFSELETPPFEHAELQDSQAYRQELAGDTKAGSMAYLHEAPSTAATALSPGGSELPAGERSELYGSEPGTPWQAHDYRRHGGWT